MRNVLFSSLSLCSFAMGTFLSGAEPVIIAHRGASGVAPENTRPAIEEAIRMGAKVIEFDVRETSDGVLVLFHDEELERLTGRQGKFASLAWEELKESDVGSWFKKGDFAGEKLLLFADAVKLCLEHGVTPLIEHKTGKAGDYAAVLKELDAVDSVIVQSFNWEFLEELKKQLPSLVIGALGSKPLDEERMGYLDQLKPEWVGWNFNDLTEERFAELKASGFSIAVWTVNDAAEAEKWIRQGIDGLITDYPDTMLLLLE